MPRLKCASLLRVFVIFVLLCAWVQIMLSASSGLLDRDGVLIVDDSSSTTTNNMNLPYKEELMSSNDTSAQVLALVPQELHKYLTVHPKNSTANSTEHVTPNNITEIVRLIEKYNDAQTIYNEDIFGPVQEDTIIIAIQVHTRIAYLRHLIVSLAQARDIDKTLLVFSHDYYDEEINSLVKTIDFTKVRAVKLKCNNALHPDVHGHYREAKYTQTKHHWWWKANRIFNQLQCTANHTGLVLFIEEDHYVAEDFIHMLDLLRTTADKNCPKCEILCLGTYLKTFQYHTTSDKRKKQLTLSYIQQVKAANEERRRRQQQTQSWNFQVYPNLYSSTQKLEITPWHSSMHNMGFGFNRTVWNLIKLNQKQFCAYDDYNWDFSLLHLSQNLPGREKFHVVLSKGPRVFHIGECGIHHKKSNCNPSTVVNKVQRLLKDAKKYMFPARVVSTVTAGGVKQNKKLVKGNGGWGDVRDHDLCTNMTKIGRQMRKDNLYLNMK
ncbi:alpha-1,6-mannosyl-glycoprotein 2-beta-N-acetylglucosaminyltransferase-like [Hyposmocoma kahamanoa]|uniref:alpha-1,6-mannosyl-glycoprotein 2-beta-N-acetylglucosaminyltransferase-like n=1 Tax=Hyposmocoma kahamanoa TaxID=1477025 RepID=UPI000E6D803D|nr:alpha-1,6-mannosyl-glycoprotein 2-beta-N-acetylglucosaminyltransferase-like [Hyposmocoma kahamanoa]